MPYPERSRATKIPPRGDRAVEQPVLYRAQRVFDAARHAIAETPRLGGGQWRADHSASKRSRATNDLRAHASVESAA